VQLPLRAGEVRRLQIATLLFPAWTPETKAALRRELAR
jgi:hypothetical protein